MTIDELIEALGKATGGDRFLDWELQRCIFPNTTFVPYDFHPSEWMTKIGDHMVPVTRYGVGGSTGDRYCPSFTSSVDRALQLVDLALPGWKVCFDATGGIADDLYLIGPDYRDDRPEENSSPPIAGKQVAVALCLSVLKAIKSRAALDAVKER